MKIISHRANLSGQDKELENNPDQISKVISLGFDVEVDAWFLDGKWFLGHDEPQYAVSSDFFANKMWIHCKNPPAISELCQINRNLNFFWHETDKMTLTSHVVPWCYPGIFVRNGITVVLEPPEGNQILDVAGICTDFPILWSKK
jgi:hypothetical protein